MIKPSFEKNNIPIVFSADSNYIKYLIVTIKSLICNSSKDYNYDIYILGENISDKYKQKALVQKKSNVNITFIDMKPILKNIDKSIFYVYDHLDIATYYRIFIPNLFKNFEKILYMDCDLIILDDVAKLYQKQLNDNFIAAVRDVIILYLINSNSKKHIDYFDNKLKLIDKNKYFQAGVMVFDIKKLLELDFENKCIEKLKEIKTPMYWDQCIMNKVLENKVEYINQIWNIQNQMSLYFNEYKKILPKNLLDEYIKGLKKPKILHFSGRTKPWQNIFLKNAHKFWKYAIFSPVFIELLSDLLFEKFTKKMKILNLAYIN